jgi:hypothetical protein
MILTIEEAYTLQRIINLAKRPDWTLVTLDYLEKETLLRPKRLQIILQSIQQQGFIELQHFSPPTQWHIRVNIIRLERAIDGALATDQREGRYHG